MRIPLPKQRPKVHKDKNKYDRKKERAKNKVRVNKNNSD
jgi:hypothetical protein